MKVTKLNYDSLNFYELYNLPSSSVDDPVDVSLVKKLFRRLSLVFHSDKDASPEARCVFERLKLAADTLCDPERRAEYNSLVLSKEQDAVAKIAVLKRAADAAAQLDSRERAGYRPSTTSRVAQERATVNYQLHEELAAMAQASPRVAEEHMMAALEVDDDTLEQKEVEVQWLMAKFLGGSLKKRSREE